MSTRDSDTWLNRSGAGAASDDAGAVLRAWRSSNGQNQTAVASLLGITQQNLSQIEKGDRPVSFELRRKLVAGCAATPSNRIAKVSIKAERFTGEDAMPTSDVDPPAYTVSAEQWLKVRAHLNQHRHALATKAVAEYPEVPQVADTPLLTNPRWMPSTPMPLTDIELQLHSGDEFHGVVGTEDVAAAALPLAMDGKRYRSYSAAMADLAAPAVFRNRSTYRLLDAELAVRASRLSFANGSYFDGIDVGEASAHEYAARELGFLDTLRLRSTVGNPCDPGRRPMNVAISTLTLRLDRTTGEATFYLHWRDPKKVGHAGGLYQVLPVGIFQASSDKSWNLTNDFSLWHCMVREFAEELLGESEEHGSDQAPIDYGSWPFAARMTEALGRQMSVSYLGMGVDPLTFATDMLTVAVIDAPLFDNLFNKLVANNDEGRVLEGLSFTADNIQRFVHNEPTQAAGAALLALAWEHREALLS